MLSGLASIEVKRGEYEAARSHLDEALKIAEAVKIDEYVTDRIQRKLAEIDIAEGNYGLAELRLKLPDGSSLSPRLLGRIAFLRQDYQLARQYFEQSLKVGQGMKSQQHIAEAKQYIAELEMTLGHKDQAQKLAQEAIEVFTKLGMKRELKETKVLLERITAELE
jgi:tetratricopeptide (TPR) repeat protein